jgi:hypothetical protein
MIGFVFGAAAGYVLGTKAGQERYEQIRKMSSQVAANPSVKRAVATVQGKLPPALQGKKPQHATPTPFTTPAPVNDLGGDFIEGGPSTPLV